MTSRVALVTGGGSGIGRAICVALAEAGHRVAVADIDQRSAAATAESIGSSALTVAMDITNGASVTDGVSKVHQEFGAVEILVNCAGWDELKPFTATDEEFWERVIDINFKGMLRTVHACVPHMTEAGWGRIINISSDAARVGSSMEAVYSGAKGAVISFTKTIARESARSGVTANVVCPGPTDTPLLDGIIAASDNGEKVMNAMARAVPMKRVGQPDEVAAAVMFFASDGAGFTTGQTISVSGGLTMA